MLIKSMWVLIVCLFSIQLGFQLCPAAGYELTFDPEKLCKKFPNQAINWKTLAGKYAREKNYTKALELLDKAEAVNKLYPGSLDNFEFHLNLDRGNYLMETNDSTRAKECYVKAFNQSRTDPSLNKIARQYLRIYFGSEDLPELTTPTVPNTDDRPPMPTSRVSTSEVPRETTSNIASTNQQSRSSMLTKTSLASPSNNAMVNRPVKDKWALVIGISKFANPKYNLDFAAKDARDFYDFLVKEANFKEDHVLLLLDEKATRENIMSAFGDNFLPAVSQEDDLVVVYMSTHGTPSKRDKGGRNYIVAHDTDTARLYATGVDMNELYRRIREGVKTDRALIVMDTCFSGAGVPGAKALNVADNFDAQEVAQGCGRLVITSSSPNERSWESKVSNNSVFTKYLLEALRSNNRKVDVKSAFKTVQERVSWEVQNAFGEKQTPQLGGEWEGKELILTIPAMAPRPMLNNDLLKIMQPVEHTARTTIGGQSKRAQIVPSNRK